MYVNVRIRFFRQRVRSFDRQPRPGPRDTADAEGHRGLGASGDDSTNLRFGQKVFGQNFTPFLDYIHEVPFKR
jgi:hypothetical protein